MLDIELERLMLKLQVKVALCQLLTTDNKEKNISTAQQAIKVKLFWSIPGHAGPILGCMKVCSRRAISIANGACRECMHHSESRLMLLVACTGL